MGMSRRAVPARVAGVLALLACGGAGAAPSWLSAPQAPTPRAEGTLIEHDGDILMLNGFTFGIKLQNTVERYDPESRTWRSLKKTTTKGPLPTAVTHQGTVVVGDEAWFIGGRIGNHPGRVTRTVAIYDLEKDSWRKGPTLPIPFAGGGAALVDRRIHLIGGLDGEARCDVATHLVYDLDQPGKGWQNITSRAALPLPRNHFGTVLHEGRIYVIGGQNGHDKCAKLEHSGKNVRHVHAYDPAKGTWKRLADLPFAQSHTEPSSFAHDGLVWVVGGQAQGNKILNYDPKTNRWKVRGDLQLPTKLIAPGARVIDGRLHVFGGGAPNVASPVRVTRTLWVGGDADEGTGGNDTDDGSDDDAVSGPVHEVRDGVARIDATEHGRALARGAHAWRPWQGALKALPDTGKLIGTADVAASPELAFSVRFERGGTHYVWVRGLGDAAGGEGKSDSLHVGLNGAVQPSADKLDGHGPSWSWRRSTRDGPVASLSVPSAGVHSLNLWMREDGLAISDIVLTTDPDFRPGAGADDADAGGGSNDGDDTDDGAGAGTGGGTGGGSGSAGSGADGGTDDGSPDLEIAPLDIDFGDVALGGTSRRELVLSNRGDGAAAIGQILLQGTAAASYRLLDDAPASLGAGETLRLAIEFAPEVAGEHVAIASLLHGPASTLTLVSLEGEGTAVGGATDGGAGASDDGGASGGGTYHHVNAGGPDVAGPDGTLWKSDLGGAAADFVRSPSWIWSSGREIVPDSATAALDAPAALFSTERYGKGGDLAWDFPVEPGDYLVHLFFAEIWKGAEKPGGRRFDIVLEGETRLSDLDVFVASGGNGADGTPTLVRSFAVSSDATLTLALERRVQNPAIKAIAIHPCPTPCRAIGIDNGAPRVLVGEDRRVALGDALALDARVDDDGLPGGTIVTRWEQRSGPARATFGDASRATTTVTFPTSGRYTLRLSADDGVLRAHDDITVTVEGAPLAATADFVETEGRVTIEAEAYSRRTASATHDWLAVDDAGASGTLAMQSGPDVGALSRGAAGSPMLAYEIDFEAPGRRYVWIRGSGDTNALGEGKSDSLHVGLDGTLSPSADKIDVFPAGWSWSRHTRDGVVASIDVPSAGVHTLNLWMREDGLKVDLIHLTRDADGQP